MGKYQGVQCTLNQVGKGEQNKVGDGAMVDAGGKKLLLNDSSIDSNPTLCVWFEQRYFSSSRKKKSKTAINT